MYIVCVYVYVCVMHICKQYQHYMSLQNYNATWGTQSNKQPSNVSGWKKLIKTAPSLPCPITNKTREIASVRKHALYDFTSFKFFLAYWANGLSWWLFHVYLKSTWFFCCQLGQIDWQCFSRLLISLLIFYLLILPIIARGILFNP